jgi:hypothetical protein
VSAPDLFGADGEQRGMGARDLRARIAVARQRAYDALKAHDLDLYRRCIQGAEAVTLNHNLGSRAASDCESVNARARLFLALNASANGAPDAIDFAGRVADATTALGRIRDDAFAANAYGRECGETMNLRIEAVAAGLLQMVHARRAAGTV